jgi:predicted AlkP superfamily pyrophosphatase or phosphodiesterase
MAILLSRLPVAGIRKCGKCFVCHTHFLVKPMITTLLVSKQRNMIIVAFLILSAIMSFASASMYAQQKSHKVNKKPRLVIALSFDQMRGDYIDKWRTYWGKTGFNRLLARGVHFTNCLNDHASNITAPGHAILMTGHYPNTTGIVSNDMYDRVIGREQYCVEDTTHQTFGIKNPRDWTSPVNLEVPTLGDILKETSPNSKVVGVSYKDRAAILMAGKKADAAFWFEAEAGGFTTSTYYGFATMPTWLAR